MSDLWGFWRQPSPFSRALAQAVKELLGFGEVLEDPNGISFLAPRPVEKSAYTIKWDDLLQKLGLHPLSSLRGTNIFYNPIGVKITWDDKTISFEVEGSGKSAPVVESPMETPAVNEVPPEENPLPETTDAEIVILQESGQGTELP